MSWLQTSTGGALWYQQQGDGRPLLFVHGWCMSGAVWQLQQQALASQCRVVTLDLAGAWQIVGSGGWHGRFRRVCR